MADVKLGSKRQSIIPMLNFMYMTLVIFLVLQPGYTKHVTLSSGREHFMQCRANVDSIHKAIEAYRKRHNGAIPTELGELCRGRDKCIDNLPICPVVEEKKMVSSYEKGYQYIQVTPFKPAVYTICCFGTNHDAVNVPKSQPYYSSVKRLHPSDFELDQLMHE